MAAGHSAPIYSVRMTCLGLLNMASRCPTLLRQHPTRRQVVDGLEMAIDSLRRAGCRTMYIDGSVVPSQEIPNDFDACWDEEGVVPELLDPVLLQFDAGRAAQKAKYLGELFPASPGATVEGMSFLEFFQTDRETGGSKGMVAVDLGGADDQE